MKTNLTKKIENALLDRCFASNNHKLAKWYGCKEVTIGFPNDRILETDNIVDFLAYDRNADNFYCFEIKVSVEDLNSDAVLSFVGNYNYLVISEDIWYKHRETLQNKLNNLEDVGLYIYENDKLKVLKNGKKKQITDKVKQTLKNSLIRSLFYKLDIANNFIREYI